MKDNTYDTDVIGAKITLYDIADSTVAAQTEASASWYAGYSGNWKEYKSSEFSFNNLPRRKRYMMEVAYEGYDTLLAMIDPASISSRQDIMDLRSVYLKRKATRLNEVTVTATKVKFYNKGDTLVYNADAFVLSEGSMLDALVSQLPGVELHPDGQIFVNGRFVESLLLNGKDFMKGDNKVLLENLGAYTVKDIKVYDRQEDMDKLLGKDYGQKKLTMDVRLNYYRVHGAAGYIVALKAGMHINTYYTFERTVRHAISDLYRLEELSDSTNFRTLRSTRYIYRS